MFERMSHCSLGLWEIQVQFFRLLMMLMVLDFELVEYNFLSGMMIITFIPMSLRVLSTITFPLSMYCQLITLDNILDAWNLCGFLMMRVLGFNQAHQQQLSLGTMTNTSEHSHTQWMSYLNFEWTLKLLSRMYFFCKLNSFMMIKSVLFLQGCIQGLMSFIKVLMAQISKQRI